MRILVINGPNLNLLGLREPDIYGNTTYDELVSMIQKHAHEKTVEVVCFQSNHEGAIVDAIQEARYPNTTGVPSVLPNPTDSGLSSSVFDAIIINPAAYTHTSVALLDVLKAVNLPTVEIHISNPNTRESFRHISYVGEYAEKTIKGQGILGYLVAIDYLIDTYG